MKIALVHDWFNTKVGGGEQVVLEFAKIFPEAPIYTLIFNQPKFKGLIDPARIRTSPLQKLPAVLKSRPRYLLPLIPRAVESFNFNEFDVVLSSSVAFTKNILTNPTTMHICYCHSPMRFAWDYWPQYLNEQNVGPLRSYFISKQVSAIRQWDYLGAARVDSWIANSKNVAKRISKYYHQEASVLYPPVDTTLFSQASGFTKKDYYVTVSSLTPYKKIDLAIEAFNISGERLVVIGEGSDRERLEKLARANIEFTGFIDNETKQRLLAEARGLIFPQEEDFGIAAVEAMAAGTPVVAFGRGGALETISAGVSGVFFSEQTPVALNQAVAKTAAIKFDPDTLRTHAARFDKSIFAAKLKTHINQAYNCYVSSNSIS